MRNKMKKTEKFDTEVRFPEDWELEGRSGDKLVFNAEREREEEMLFHSQKDFIFPSSLRSEFENDSVIVLVFSKSGELFLHRRSCKKNWEPGKVDLASVAGQSRAVFEDKKFRREDSRETAVREVKEETGAEQKLSPESFERIGEHFNPETGENQTVFAIVLDLEVEELNRNAPEDEVYQWLKKDFEETLEEYFGEEVEKYAGGKELRPENFISDEVIRENLKSFHVGLYQ